MVVDAVWLSEYVSRLEITTANGGSKKRSWFFSLLAISWSQAWIVKLDPVSTHEHNFLPTNLPTLPHGGTFAKRQPGGGALSKTTQSFGLYGSIWFQSNMCKHLHNCFHLRTRDDRKRNVHGT